MGKHKNKAYSLRIDPLVMDKLRYIAESDDRSVNTVIERLIKTYIKEYEQEHGEIEQKKDS